MKIQKLPNRCYFPVFVILIGSLGLEANGQVPVRSLETPLPANRVPVRLDNRAFKQQQSEVDLTVPIIRTVPIVKSSGGLIGQKSASSNPVPIIGVDAFSKFPKQEPKNSGTLDFSQQVPVVRMGAPQSGSQATIPDFGGPIDLKVVPIVKSSNEVPPIVKSNSLPPIISQGASNEKMSEVKPVIFVSRGDSDQEDGKVNPSIALQRFEKPTKPLPVIIRTGQGVEPLSQDETPRFKSVPIKSASGMAVQGRPSSVLITKQPEAFQDAQDERALNNSALNNSALTQEAQLLPPIKTTRPLPPINSIEDPREIPKSVVVENEKPVPVVKPGEIVNDYFKSKGDAAKRSAELPPIVASQPDVAPANIPVIRPKVEVQPLPTPVLQSPVQESPIQESLVRKERKSLPPVVASLPSSSIPVMPLKQVVPKTVANEVERNSSDVGTIAIPVKPMKNLAITNPFIKTAEPKRTVAPKAASRVKRVAKQQDVMPNSGLGLGPDGMIQDITSTMGPVSMGSGAFPRSPFAVFRAEALYMNRENGSTRFSDSFSLDPFDYELGVRLHMQRIFGVEGTSITYSGIQEWNDVFRLDAPGGATIIPDTSAAPIIWAPFKGANFQQQYHNANYHNLELNKVTWGWDVLNLFWGFRYTHYEEEFDFYSRRPDNQQGLLLMDMENHVFGPQVGGEVFYDIGKLISTGVKLKLGGTINFLSRDTTVISNGVTRLNTDDNDSTFNLALEMAAFSRLRVGPNAHLRAGYEIWYNSKMYTVKDNIPSALNSSFGTTSSTDDVFIHGLTIGFEVLR